MSLRVGNSNGSNVIVVNLAGHLASHDLQVVSLEGVLLNQANPFCVSSFLVNLGLVFIESLLDVV